MQGVMSDKHGGNSYGMLKRTTLKVWQCNGSILQTISEMVEDGYEGSASWCFKTAGKLRYAFKCFTSTAI